MADNKNLPSESIGEQSSEGRLPSLDGLRALSVAMVVGGHLAYTGTAPAAFKTVLLFSDGALGVRFFFVISGFIISTLLINEGANGSIPSLKRFYLRRFIRLVPVQIVFLAALLLLTLYGTLNINSCQFLTSLTYTKNYGCSSWIDGHLWSLSVEEQFYILWPFILLYLPRKWVVPVAAILIALSPISRAIEYSFVSRNWRPYSWLISNADALMVGCILALAAQKYTSTIRSAAHWHSNLMRLVAISAMAVPIILSHYLLLGWFTVMFGPLVQSVAAGYLVASFVFREGGAAFRLLNSRILSYVGLTSYSIYVWQQPFLSKPETYGLSESLLLSFPYNLIGAVGAGIISYHLLEKPLMKLRQRLRRPERSSN